MPRGRPNRVVPARTKWFFDRFIRAADRQMLNLPSDWKTFYHFIYAAHRYKAKLSAVKVEEHLKKAGFPADDADNLALVYAHGRALLKANPALYYILLKETDFFDSKRKGK